MHYYCWYVSLCPHRWLCGGTSLLPQASLDPSSTDLKPHIQPSSTGQDYPCLCFRATWGDSEKLASKNHTTSQITRPWGMLTKPNPTACSHRVNKLQKTNQKPSALRSAQTSVGQQKCCSAQSIFWVFQLEPKVTLAFRLGITLHSACMMPSDTGPGFHAD